MDEQRLILVVEDDEPTRGFLAENLAADGFRVAGAASAAEALRAIEVRQPALVVLDLRLEAGSGLDVLDRVRSADGLASRLDPDLPVIVLTGRSGAADRVRSFARGADDHLNKPMRPDVAAAFDRMAAAARREAGLYLSVNSAFRSDAEQQVLWNANPNPKWVAPPGTSLHRYATELDLGPSIAYPWLAANHRRFGFILRYAWEPWH